ncbi:hypothetical protein ACWV95_20165 [Streptomyces albus]
MPRTSSTTTCGAPWECSPHCACRRRICSWACSTETAHRWKAGNDTGRPSSSSFSETPPGSSFSGSTSHSGCCGGTAGNAASPDRVIAASPANSSSIRTFSFDRAVNSSRV